MKRLLFALLVTLLTANGVNADWKYHFWTAEEVRMYQPRRVDLIGKAWWMQYREGEPYTDNKDEVGEKPLYFRMWVSPMPYVQGSGRYGHAYIRTKFDLKQDKWTEHGQWRNWEATSKWHMRTITIPIWDEEYANQIRNSPNFFMDVGDLTRIHKWVMYDGDKEIVLIDHLTPKPEPVQPTATQKAIASAIEKVVEFIAPAAEEIKLPPMP